ncbi:ParB N-terminal domain-containing protein [Actinomadura viridis]|uniref:ParB-like chromosome segregation protein Spo0J n=1 Tax=Actinomadura viridis TaxID=58110 RepID=A0A931DUA7_9ACTN|nr:ParB N-terminal domain-containing protein [Actinomadura viridis]MBG6094001.1 ParB-like chromosome segregation protein Spo0J [Actinomadura viridis]
MEFRQEQGDLSPVVDVEVSALSITDSPRISGENPEHVEALAAAQAELPPILVHRPTMRVIDGLHRVLAARLRGDEKIRVRFFDGDDADAFVMAVRSNIAHGLPLSLADRKRAAERIVVSHPRWSDRMVASATGIAAGTVAEIRRRVPAGAAAEPLRIGQDGRVRPINGAEGRRVAAELINENPSLSLRQIAQAAGISPETARDVRNRLRRGEDPLPKRMAGTVSLASRRNTHAERKAAVQTPARDRAAIVERLKADPALRFNETGRNLLMLLNLHTMKTADWDTMINNVPPHCAGIVAQLARDCADVWADFAIRVERQIASIV